MRIYVYIYGESDRQARQASKTDRQAYKTNKKEKAREPKKKEKKKKKGLPTQKMKTTRELPAAPKWAAASSRTNLRPRQCRWRNHHPHAANLFPRVLSTTASGRNRPPVQAHRPFPPRRIRSPQQRPPPPPSLIYLLHERKLYPPPMRHFSRRHSSPHFFAYPRHR